MPPAIEKSSWLVQVAFMLITGKHFGPFWFIPMISLIYLIAPFLVYLDRNSWFYRYLFPLIILSSCFLYRFGYNSSIFESILYFLPVYIFGMWASRYRESIISKGHGLLVPLTLFYIFVTYLEIVNVLAIGKSYAFGEELKENSYLLNFGKLKALALCIILLLLLYRLRHIKAKVLRLLATYSFGIFFIHLYVIRLIEIIIARANVVFSFNSGLYLGHICLITVICLFIVWSTKVIVGNHSRYIIGC